MEKKVYFVLTILFFFKTIFFGEYTIETKKDTNKTFSIQNELSFAAYKGFIPVSDTINHVSILYPFFKKEILSRQSFIAPFIQSITSEPSFNNTEYEFFHLDFSWRGKEKNRSFPLVLGFSGFGNIFPEIGYIVLTNNFNSTRVRVSFYEENVFMFMGTRYINYNKYYDSHNIGVNIQSFFGTTTLYKKLTFSPEKEDIELAVKNLALDIKTTNLTEELIADFSSYYVGIMLQQHLSVVFFKFLSIKVMFEYGLFLNNPRVPINYDFNKTEFTPFFYITVGFSIIEPQEKD